MITLRKLDILLAVIIGEFIALVILLIGKNIGIEIPFVFWLPIIFPILAPLGLYLTYLVGKKLAVIFQAGKYFLVGSFNTFLDFGVLNLLIFLTAIPSGAWYSVFKSVSFLVAVTNSYFWNKLWTFQSEEGSFIQFFAVSIVGFGLNVGVASLIVNVMGPVGTMSPELWANIGALAAVVISLVWNFIGYKFIVFKK